jgi:uncharacterized membrane protein YgdD (TMEM256/DUF423 family)
MEPHSDRLALRLGAIFGFFGVIMGTLAAHGPVRDFLDAHARLDLWRTGLNYQWLHALAFLAVGQAGAARRRSVVLWLIGVTCFSGSLYILALDPRQVWAGPITPIGGLFLLAGWASLWFSSIRRTP